MIHPIKEQCPCGCKDLKLTEKGTHNQYECKRCKRVHVTMVRISKERGLRHG